MSGMPIDLFAVFDELGDIESARALPVSVMLFIDPTADERMADSVRAAFATGASNATVRFCDYSAGSVEPPRGCDLGVLVAGSNENTGEIATALRAVGVPALTVTNMPESVLSIARSLGHALLEEDVISPKAYVDGSAFSAEDEFNREPYPMTVDRTRTLIDRMGTWIVKTFREKRLAFSLAFAFVRRPLANECINSTSVQNAGIGIVFFIPGADMPLMTLNQVKMVMQIAAAYGLEVDATRARGIVCVVAGGFVFRAIAREMAPLVPGAGWAVKGGIGAAGTQAMGRAALAYIENIAASPNALGSCEKDSRANEALHNVQIAVQPWATAALAAMQAGASAAVDSANAAFERAKPKIQAQVAAARPYMEQAAQAVAPYVQAGAQQIVDAAGNAANFVAEKVAPAAAQAVKKAAPVAQQMAEGAFPLTTKAVSTVVPLAQDTVKNFCERQGIDPAQFASQMADSFVEAANNQARR